MLERERAERREVQKMFSQRRKPKENGEIEKGRICCSILRDHEIPHMGADPSRGFPHSDICGSKLICSSPQLFAACHVLLRLLMPRHSPYALLSLNSFVYLPIYSFSLSLELLCITFFSCFSISLWQNCFFYPLERPDFLIYFKISSFSLFA